MTMNHDGDAKLVITEAKRTAIRTGHRTVEPEHFLVGLFELQSSLVVQILECLPIPDLAQGAKGVVSELRAGTSTYTPLDSEPRGFLARCETEANALDDALIGPEHILLAILSYRDSTAARYITSQGVGTQPVAQALAHLRAGRTPADIRDVVERDAHGRILVPTPAMWALRGMCESATEACFNGFLVDTTSTSVRKAEIRRILQVLSRNTRASSSLASPASARRSYCRI